MGRPERQEPCGPPRDIPRRIGVADVQSGRSDLSHRSLKPFVIAGMAHLVKRGDIRIGHMLPDPAHGNGRPFIIEQEPEQVVRDGSVRRDPHVAQHIRAQAHLNAFTHNLAIHPFSPVHHLVRVFRVHLFQKHVNIIIEEHRNSPGPVLIMAQQRHGNRRQMITVVFKRTIFHMRFVPDAGIGEGDVWIIREDGLAARGLVAGEHPGIASQLRAGETAEGGDGVQPADGAFQAPGNLRDFGRRPGAVTLVFGRFLETLHNGYGHLFKFREKRLDVPFGYLLF